jgi:hypothetical protein
MNKDNQAEQDEGLALWRYGERVRGWQNLARRYRQEGLTSEEMEQLWAELRQKKTNVDLILEVTMKSPDWRQASKEAQVFLDRLAKELEMGQILPKKNRTKAKDTVGTDKIWEKSSEGQLRREMKQNLNKQYQLEKNLALVDDLARVMMLVITLMQTSVDFKQEVKREQLVKQPQQVLAFMERYLQEKALVAKGNQTSFQSLRLLMMGKIGEQ